MGGVNYKVYNVFLLILLIEKEIISHDQIPDYVFIAKYFCDFIFRAKKRCRNE